MSTRTLRDPQRRQRADDITALRAAADRSSDLVHLAQCGEGIRAQAALCGAPLSRRPPRRLLHEAACTGCVAAALELGATCAEDRHGVLVNLRRVPRREGPQG